MVKCLQKNFLKYVKLHFKQAIAFGNNIQFLKRNAHYTTPALPEDDSNTHLFLL